MGVAEESGSEQQRPQLRSPAIAGERKLPGEPEAAEKPFNGEHTRGIPEFEKPQGVGPI